MTSKKKVTPCRSFVFDSVNERVDRGDLVDIMYLDFEAAFDKSFHQWLRPD